MSSKWTFERFSPLATISGAFKSMALREKDEIMATSAPVWGQEVRRKGERTYHLPATKRACNTIMTCGDLIPDDRRSLQAFTRRTFQLGNVPISVFFGTFPTRKRSNAQNIDPYVNELSCWPLGPMRVARVMDIHHSIAVNPIGREPQTNRFFFFVLSHLRQGGRG